MRTAASAALFSAALGVLLITGAPAALLDAALDRASAGRFRLALTEGTLWNGQGRLATADSSDTLSPVTRLRWQLEPAALFGARLRWALEIDGGAPATLELGPGGFALLRAKAQLPPAAALSAVPHAVARAGWRGLLELYIPTLTCRWNGNCTGTVHAEWRAGGVDILPAQALGDHRIVAQLNESATRIEISAVRGLALAVNGELELATGRRPRVDLEIGGDAQLLGRLQGMLAELGPTRNGERLKIRF